jgi:hypothetical protein
MEVSVMCTNRGFRKHIVVLLAGLLWTFGVPSLAYGAEGDANEPNTVLPVVVPDDVPTIQEAIDSAVPGQVVVLRPGIYSGPGNRDLDFKGKAITVQSENPLDLAVVAATVIDCNGEPNDQHRGFVFKTGEEASSILAGLTIINGCYDRGGAVYVSRSSPAIASCIFRDNLAIEGGGALYSYGGSPAIRACVFNSNTAGLPGDPNGCGGAIYNMGSSPTVVSSLFTGNSAQKSGGVLQCDSFEESVFCPRRICVHYMDVPLPGGGWTHICTQWMQEPCPIIWETICTPGHEICIPGPDICWNEPSTCIYLPNGQRICIPGAQHCVPGPMHCIPGIPTCTKIPVIDCPRCTVQRESSPVFANCTFVANTSAQGAALDLVGSGSVTVRNSILWDNSPEDANSAGKVAITYSDVQGGFAGEGNIDADPMFVDLINGDYHLQSGSPCVDAGDPKTTIDPSETDLDGNPRLAGAEVDIGAYEFFVPVPQP